MLYFLRWQICEMFLRRLLLCKQESAINNKQGFSRYHLTSDAVGKNITPLVSLCNHVRYLHATLSSLFFSTPGKYLFCIPARAGCIWIYSIPRDQKNNNQSTRLGPTKLQLYKKKSIVSFSLQNITLSTEIIASWKMKFLIVLGILNVFCLDFWQVILPGNIIRVWFPCLW